MEEETCGFITSAFGVCAERGPTFLPARLAGAPLPLGFAASGPGDFLTVCLSPSNTGTWTRLSRNPAHLASRVFFGPPLRQSLVTRTRPYQLYLHQNPQESQLPVGPPSQGQSTTFLCFECYVPGCMYIEISISSRARPASEPDRRAIDNCGTQGKFLNVSESRFPHREGD